MYFKFLITKLKHLDLEYKYIVKRRKITILDTKNDLF